MSTTPTERTVLPAGPVDRLAELLAALETVRRPALVAVDGTRIERVGPACLGGSCTGRC